MQLPLPPSHPVPSHILIGTFSRPASSSTPFPLPPPTAPLWVSLLHATFLPFGGLIKDSGAHCVTSENWILLVPNFVSRAYFW